MDSLIFELQIVFYFQLFLSANVRHNDMTLVRFYCYLYTVILYVILHTTLKNLKLHCRRNDFDLVGESTWV